MVKSYNSRSIGIEIHRQSQDHKYYYLSEPSPVLYFAAGNNNGLKSAQTHDSHELLKDEHITNPNTQIRSGGFNGRGGEYGYTLSVDRIFSYSCCIIDLMTDSLIPYFLDIF